MMTYSFIGFGAASALLFASASTASIITPIASETFDGGATWTNDHAAQLFSDPSSDPSDPQGLLVRPGLVLGPDDVLFGKDLQNEGGEPDLNPVTITFDAVDVSDYFGVEFSFEYFLSGFEDTDMISWVLSYDGGSIADSIAGPLVPDPSIGTYTASIPDSATSVSLILTLDQNGPSDRFELDNFQLTGHPVPEPASVALIAAGASLVLGRRRRD